MNIIGRRRELVTVLLAWAVLSVVAGVWLAIDRKSGRDT